MNSSFKPSIEFLEDRLNTSVIIPEARVMPQRPMHSEAVHVAENTAEKQHALMHVLGEAFHEQNVHDSEKSAERMAEATEVAHVHLHSHTVHIHPHIHVEEKEKDLFDTLESVEPSPRQKKLNLAAKYINNPAMIRKNFAMEFPMVSDAELKQLDAIKDKQKGEEILPNDIRLEMLFMD